jgi:uncharacterized protein (DUF924 family)
MQGPGEVLRFWFEETPRSLHFATDPELDADIRDRFGELWQKAQEGALAAWEETAEGALALIVLMDQFPRNMFRGTGLAFATDPDALAVAERAVARGFDMQTRSDRRTFFFMPFMHAENLDAQDACVRLLRERAPEAREARDYAERHREVIEKFGRFPARNRALARSSTGEEIAFLAEHPSGF